MRRRGEHEKFEAGDQRSDDGAYVCPSCGEEIVVPLDPSGGDHQSYVEDCPVCCAPNVVHDDFDADGAAHVTAESE